MGVRTGVERRPVAGQTAAASGWKLPAVEERKNSGGKRKEKEEKRKKRKEEEKKKKRRGSGLGCPPAQLT
ncbi:hypothetical protein ACLB2K_016988 [Fragaria x ananassa]